MSRKRSKKVILIGHFNVGKTSLIRKFVHSKFSDEYLTTIGVKIEKKILEVNGEDMTMIIWDIAGETNVDRIQPAFLMGASGIIYVYDLTRESTYENMEEQLTKLRSKLPKVPFRIIGNKKDLLTDDAIEKIKKDIPFKTDYVSSAKTGEMVEELFMDLAVEMF